MWKSAQEKHVNFQKKKKKKKIKKSYARTKMKCPNLDRKVMFLETTEVEVRVKCPKIFF